MLNQRSIGILLHPTSLPGKYRIGTLGKEAFHFIDFLSKADQHLWQILPLYVAYDSVDVWLKNLPALQNFTGESQRENI